MHTGSKTVTTAKNCS